MSLEEVITKAVESSKKMLKEGKPKTAILTHLAITADQVSGTGSATSILLLDKRGLLRNCASPKLPADFLAAIDGIKPDPKVGTCAAAAATGTVVFTASFRDDEKWAELRHLPEAIGYVGAWSCPIKDRAGMVLGTFGTYFSEVRLPRDEEVTAISRLANEAAEILQERF